MAHAFESQIAPTVVGRVQTVVVALNDRVVAGQAVVLLDDSLLNASITTANANLRKLRAESRGHGRLAGHRLGTHGRRHAAPADGGERPAPRGAVAEGQLEGDTIEVQRLTLEAQRQEQLVRQGIGTKAQYDNAKLARDGLSATTEQTQALLAQTEKEWERRRAVASRSSGRCRPVRCSRRSCFPLQEDIAVEEAALREIEVQRAALVLRSPIAGQVSQVWCTAGQSVKPGDPILTIVESAVRDIVVFVDETSSRRIAPQQRVVISRAVPPAAKAESSVVSVGETVQQLPPRFWRDPRVPSYGRTVVVAPSSSLPLAVGELVDVRLPAFR